MDFSNLHFEDFKILQKLDAWAQGRSYLVSMVVTQDKYTIKKYSQQDKERLIMQIETMKKLTSRFTVKLMGTFQHGPDMCVLLDFYEGGNIKKLISDLQRIPEQKREIPVWGILSQIVRSLDHLHSNNVVHGNIKPENIFIMGDGTIRLSDFGQTVTIQGPGNPPTSQSRIYFAAEVWTQGKPSLSSDIYSLGLIACELITGRHPFNAGNEKATVDRIRKGNQIMFPQFIPKDMKELIMSMTSKDPNKRPTTKVILQHESISKNNKIQMDKERNAEMLKRKAATAIGSIAHTQIASEILKDVKREGETFTHTDKNTNSSVLLFDPIIEFGVIRIECINIQGLFEVGIADENVRFARNEKPSIREMDKMVIYLCNGQIKHSGEWIKDNAKFDEEENTVALELNMGSEPRTLTFFVNNQEQPNYVTHIPPAVRFWAYFYDKGDQFQITKFKRDYLPTAKHGGKSKAWQYGLPWLKPASKSCCAIL